MGLDATKLAATMETCLAEVWQEKKNETLPVTGQADRAILFEAIARAVVRHLQSDAVVIMTDAKHDHKNAITCNVSVDSKTSGGAALNHNHDADCATTIQEHSHTHTGKVK